MSTNNIRIGIVGAGYWGPNLIRNCVELGLLDSVCDIDERALERVKGNHPNIATTTVFKALLGRPIDAIIIAAPAQFHAEMCLEAISAGKHVFVEKPLALSVGEGEQIAAAAEAAGVSVFVGHVLLYHPAVKKLRSLIAGGTAGDVWHARFRRVSLGKLRSHESVWWSFAPHDVALMLAIMGEEPRKAVSSQTCGRGTWLSDVAYADFEFSKGRSAHIEVCWLDPEKSARLDVFCSKAVITLTDSRKGSSLIYKPVVLSEDESGGPVALRGEERNIDYGADEPLKAEINAFVDSIVTGNPTETDARQGIAVLRALTLADEGSSKCAQLRALA